MVSGRGGRKREKVWLVKERGGVVSGGWRRERCG